jgi:hypothetical protein
MSGECPLGRHGGPSGLPAPPRWPSWSDGRMRSASDIDGLRDDCARAEFQRVRRSNDLAREGPSGRRRPRPSTAPLRRRLRGAPGEFARPEDAPAREAVGAGSRRSRLPPPPARTRPGRSSCGGPASPRACTGSGRTDNRRTSACRARTGRRIPRGARPGAGSPGGGNLGRAGARWNAQRKFSGGPKTPARRRSASSTVRDYFEGAFNSWPATIATRFDRSSPSANRPMEAGLGRGAPSTDRAATGG